MTREINIKPSILSVGENKMCLELLEIPELNCNQIHFLRSLVDDYINQIECTAANRELLYQMFYRQSAIK